MIKRLRNRFIRIAMLSVTAVMLLLTIILNVAQLRLDRFRPKADALAHLRKRAAPSPTPRFLQPIGSDSADAPDAAGKMTAAAADIAPAPPDDADDSQTPQAPPDDKVARREGPFTAETPFSTRFFVLRLRLRAAR